MTAALVLGGVAVDVDPPVIPVVDVEVPGSVVDLVVVPGIPGPAGPAGDGGQTHVQSVAAASWVITHGLGRYPSAVTVVVDDAEVTTDVFYPDRDTVTITFTRPTVGRAEII